jgi:MFS family permease
LAGSLIFANGKPLKSFFQTGPWDKKQIFWGLLALVLLSVVCGLYFHWDLASPRYFSIDAASHFKGVKSILNEPTSSPPPYYAFFYVFSKMTLLGAGSILNLLKIYQLYYIFFYGVTSIYCLAVFQKLLPVKKKMLQGAALALISLGFLFNLMIMGFLSQLTGLFLLLAFIDIYTLKKKDHRHWFVLALIFLSLGLCYVYWLAPAIIFIAVSELYQLSLFPGKKNFLFKSAIILLLGFAAFVFHNALKVLNVDGETYKIYLANFLIFSPLIAYGSWRLIKQFKDSETASFGLLYVSSLIFGLILYVAYFFDLASSYSFAKSMYLLGPILFYLSIYALDQMALSFKKKYVSGTIAAIFLAVFAAAIFRPFYDYSKFHNTLEEAQAVEADLLGSLDKKNLMNPAFRPLDIFHFNAAFALYPQTYRLENFVTLDRTKIDFIERVAKYLKNKNDPSKKLYVVGDLKTSDWFSVLSGINNVNFNDLKNYNSNIMDYSQWQKSHEQPYIVIFETQTAQKWYWVNRDTFHLSDYDIIYQSGQNFLLKLKQ